MKMIVCIPSNAYPWASKSLPVFSALFRHHLLATSGKVPGGLKQILIARGPVGAMILAKRAFNKALFAGLEGALDYEAHLQCLSPVYPASP